MLWTYGAEAMFVGALCLCVFKQALTKNVIGTAEIIRCWMNISRCFDICFVVPHRLVAGNSQTKQAQIKTRNSKPDLDLVLIKLALYVYVLFISSKQSLCSS